MIPLPKNLNQLTFLSYYDLLSHCLNPRQCRLNGSDLLLNRAGIEAFINLDVRQVKPLKLNQLVFEPSTLNPTDRLGIFCYDPLPLFMFECCHSDPPIITDYDFNNFIKTYSLSDFLITTRAKDYLC